MSHKQQYEAAQYVANLTSHLYNSHLNCDILLKVFDEPMLQDEELANSSDIQINAHSAILSAASQPMSAMLHPSGQFSESRAGVVEVHGVRQSAFAAVVRFIYTGRVTISSLREAAPLYQAADMYDINELKEFARRAVKSCLDASVIDFGDLNRLTESAEAYRAQPLFEMCVEQISLCADDLYKANMHVEWSKSTWGHLLSLSEINSQELDTLKALMDWAAEDSEKLKELIELIRFQDIPTQKIKNLYESKLVKADILLSGLLKGSTDRPTRQRGLVKYQGANATSVLASFSHENFRQETIPFDDNSKTFWEIEILAQDVNRGNGKDSSFTVGIGIDRQCFYSDRYYFDNRGLFWRSNGEIEDNLSGGPYMDSKNSKLCYRPGNKIGFLIDLASKSAKLFCFLDRKLLHVLPLKEKRTDYVPLMYVRRGAIQLLPPAKEPLYLDINM